MVQDVFQLASGGSLLSCTSGTKIKCEIFNLAWLSTLPWRYETFVAPSRVLHDEGGALVMGLLQGIKCY